MSEPDIEKKILVVEKAGPGKESNCAEGDVRKWKTVTEAFSDIDTSPQHSFCKTCGHDIDIHAPVEDYKVRFAGECQHVLKCPCKQYIPGEVKTEKEMGR